MGEQSGEERRDTRSECLDCYEYHHGNYRYRDGYTNSDSYADGYCRSYSHHTHTFTNFDTGHFCNTSSPAGFMSAAAFIDSQNSP